MKRIFELCDSSVMLLMLGKNLQMRKQERNKIKLTKGFKLTYLFMVLKTKSNQTLSWHNFCQTKTISMPLKIVCF